MRVERGAGIPVWQLERVEQQELLDLGHGTAHDVRRNLMEMQRINRWLGGEQALTRHLYPRLLAVAEPQVLIDAGTGAAGMLVDIVRWARRRRLNLRALAVDWSARNLRALGGPLPGEIQRVQADALALPLLCQSVDWVISSLFLHHLEPAQVVSFLRSAFRLAKRGIVMNDLTRGYLPMIAFRAIQPVFARCYLTRQDGMLSIRRAYTPSELLEMALQAGLPEPCVVVHTHFPWRMTLTADHDC